MKIRTYFIIFLVIAMGFTFLSWAYEEVLAGTKLWESSSHRNEIPKEAIRLRILANSDGAQDQWIKRKVRDEIIKELEAWTRRPQNIDAARQLIQGHLPMFKQIAEQTVRKAGFNYPVHVDFGQVSFPTKLYGNKVYPAGKYEALRVTLGAGEGDNWWCVLFPPLCFVDMESGEAIPKKRLSASLSPQAEVLAAGADQEVDRPNSKEVLKVRLLLVDQIATWVQEMF
ncbi:stage II sporulation protein R [Thermoflavimicrobium daqui]|uniref:Stage II sporulation protein R n=1 Tax=Thermoflavimicrobium daqui TaxID=2137476 RepID=A0A364K3C0_9BACL|nr:stage II sporulation protein R [Thermoflavimicrobium daqui]RAL23329.1 stage II sporulation protein R [Thermoflavimicrobium daqui]